MTIEDILENEQKEEQPSRGGLSLGSIVLLLGVVAVIVVVGMQFVAQNQSRPMEGPAPTFTLTTFDGQPFDLEAHRGEIVIVNFWGSWCGPCRAEAPRLQQLHQDYADRGVTLLGVTYLDDDDSSLAFMDQYGLTYLNAPDPQLRVADAYHITGAPETFVIDQQGNVVEVVVGEITDLQMTRLRDRLDVMLADGTGG